MFEWIRANSRRAEWGHTVWRASIPGQRWPSRQTSRRPSLAAGWAALGIATALACTPIPEKTPPKGDPVRGGDIFAIAGGCGCHTMEVGGVGGGGRALETPFGIFYSSNITSDPETGLGKWTDEEIERAIRKGDLPDGRVESPAMPYYRYSGMSDRDVRDLIAYLRTLPPVQRENIPHETDVAPSMFRAWRLLHGDNRKPPAEAPASGPERGRYLTDHVAICGDCHTPRGATGQPDRSMYLAGTRRGPLNAVVPNITSHDQTGIGEWTSEEIESALDLGMRPDLDSLQGLMAEVVDGFGGGVGYAHAPHKEIEAIAQWIQRVPPIDNPIDEDAASAVEEPS